MRRLLIFLSGARPDILDNCPSEKSKFEGIGAAVLTTSTLAFLSMTFALTAALGVNFVLAMLLGFGWGLAIMFLDRWLVASISTSGPGRFALALPRLLLSLLFGIIISTPLILQIFKPEIDAQIVAIKQQRADSFQQNLATGEVGTEIARLTNVVNGLRMVIASGGDVPLDPAQDPGMKTLIADRDYQQGQANKYYDLWQCQLYGAKCPQGIKGNGALARATEQNYRAARQLIEKLNAQIENRKRHLTATSESAKQVRLAQAKADLPGYQAQLDRHIQQQNSLRSQFYAENQSSDGLLLRLEALDEVSGTNTTLNLARLLIFLMLMLIECLPVVVKLMHRPGNYEKVLAFAERQELRIALEPQTSVGGPVSRMTLEEVWGREPDGPEHPPQPSPKPIPSLLGQEDLEDRALRGMRDARIPDHTTDRVARHLPGG
ncbi:DUF4407 domain-containing protein [Nonomuraea sp. NPDC049028]|uniref:DUF4407 domain-containing protein n=1 Tax=Nonomuraea sp. NPDC049028 TaxID=3364348 RepID=UPI0037114893